MTTTNLWLRGLLTAALSGIGSAAGAILIDPQHFSLAQLEHVAIVAGAGAIMGVIGWLRQSPLPPD